MPGLFFDEATGTFIFSVDTPDGSSAFFNADGTPHTDEGTVEGPLDPSAFPNAGPPPDSLVVPVGSPLALEFTAGEDLEGAQFISIPNPDSTGPPVDNGTTNGTGSANTSVAPDNSGNSSPIVSQPIPADAADNSGTGGGTAGQQVVDNAGNPLGTLPATDTGPPLTVGPDGVPLSTEPPNGGFTPTGLTSDQEETVKTAEQVPVVGDFLGNAIQFTVGLGNIGNDFLQQAAHPGSSALAQQTSTDIANTLGRGLLIATPLGEAVTAIPKLGGPAGNIFVKGVTAAGQIFSVGANAIIGAAFNIESQIQAGAFNLANPGIVINPATVNPNGGIPPPGVTNSTGRLQSLQISPSQLIDPSTITANGDTLTLRSPEETAAANTINAFNGPLLFQGDGDARGLSQFMASDGFLRTPDLRPPTNPFSTTNVETPQQISDIDGTYQVTPETIGTDLANVQMSFYNNGGNFGSQEVVKLVEDLSVYEPGSDPHQSNSIIATTEGVILAGNTNIDSFIDLIKLVQGQMDSPSNPNIDPLYSYINDFALTPNQFVGGSITQYLADINSGQSADAALADTLSSKSVV